MKTIFDLIQQIKAEGGKLAVLIIDEEVSAAHAKEGQEFLHTKYQREVLLKCSKLGIPSIFVTMDMEHVNPALSAAVPKGLKTQIRKQTFNAMASISLTRELRQKNISHVVVMGTHTDMCVKATIFGGYIHDEAVEELRTERGVAFLKQQGVSAEDLINGGRNGLLGFGIQVITAHELVSGSFPYQRIKWPKAEGLTIFETPRRQRFFSSKEEAGLTDPLEHDQNQASSTKKV